MSVYIIISNLEQQLFRISNTTEKLMEQCPSQVTTSDLRGIFLYLIPKGRGTSKDDDNDDDVDCIF